jgi:ATP-dependent DNA helicase RecG
MRDSMKAGQLPEPSFSQEQVAHALVKVTLQNNIHLRKVWIDRDVSAIIGTALASSLTTDETRVLNFIAERGLIKVNDVVRVIEVSWDRADKLLKGLWRKRVLQYIRFRPFEKNRRDPNAFFRLRSAEPLPEGAHEASDR